MDKNELIPHLFRSEAGKITAVLCKRLGMEHADVAEDIAAEAFLSALETWPYKGVPENPVAWLYAVAKNKAKNYLLRNQRFVQKVAPQLKQAPPDCFDLDLSEKNIADSQLQLLFAICHPSIATEAQIGLALRILCGFGIDEIATAFLTQKDTINKRLFRAKSKLRLEKVVVELPSETAIHQRLEAVLTTLYLLFNEGYYSESHDAVLRKDLCLEAMRLTHLLASSKHTNQPAVNALLALMCFHASRFEARTNEQGELVLYQEQDETRWDRALISNGAYYLRQAAQGDKVSKYHLEASIAYWHTIKADTKEKWERILHLFDQLLQMEYSPIAALNRAYALSKVSGNQVALVAVQELQLTDNPYYFTLLGTLYADSDPDTAKKHYQKAVLLAKTMGDRQILQMKIRQLEFAK